MAVITIKVVDRKGDTLTEKSAPEQVSLVYDGLYQEGDIILVETDRPQQFCVVHLEDTMPPALVFLPGGAMEFPIPPADNRMNYNPRSFVGRWHLLSARCAAAEELKGPRNLAFNPYDCHGENGVYPTPPPMWKRGARRCLPHGTRWMDSLRMTPMGSGLTRAGASTETPTQP